MSDAEVPLFPETARIREAMTIVNDLDAKKLNVVLGRLAKAIGAKTVRETTAFNESERQELLEHLHLTSSELETLLGACSFILEQSAYHLVKPADLSSQLQNLGMGELQVTDSDQLESRVHTKCTRRLHLQIAGALFRRRVGKGGERRTQVRPHFPAPSSPP
jgi:hypothetical protein